MPEINILLLTAAFETATPDTVPATALVVIETVPPDAELGICNTTEKLHVSPADSSPPAKVSTELPEMLEPVPHTSFCVALVATSPVNAASKSTLKPNSVASALALAL